MDTPEAQRRRTGGEAQAAGCCLLVLLVGVAGVLALLSTQQNATVVSAPHAPARALVVHSRSGPYVRSDVTAGVTYATKTYDSFAVKNHTVCKRTCEADAECGTWAVGACLGGDGLQAHVCYLGEKTDELADLAPVSDKCSAFGGRVLRTIAKTTKETAHVSARSYATSYAEAANEYAGEIYASFSARDAQKCKAACLADARCDNWVIGLCVGGGGLQAHVCYLKTHTAAAVRMADKCAAFGGTVERSGHVHVAFVPVDAERDRGHQYDSFGTRSRAICQSTCESDSRCRSWVHGVCASSTDAEPTECFLSSTAEPIWPPNDPCAVFGGAVQRTRSFGYGEPITAAPSDTPTTRTPTATSAPTAEELPTWGGTAKGASCVFPFKYRGRWFTECTHDHWAGHASWCATTAVYHGVWGHCGPRPPASASSSSSSSSGGSSAAAPPASSSSSSSAAEPARRHEAHSTPHAPPEVNEPAPSPSPPTHTARRAAPPEHHIVRSVVADGSGVPVDDGPPAVKHCVTSHEDGQLVVRCTTTVRTTPPPAALPPPPQPPPPPRNVNLVVKQLPLPPPPPPPPAPPTNIHLYVQAPHGAPPPPPQAQPLQIQIGDLGNGSNAEASAKRLVVEGTQRDGNHLLIHVNPGQISTTPKVVTLGMNTVVAAGAKPAVMAAPAVTVPAVVQQQPIYFRQAAPMVATQVVHTVQTPNCESTLTAGGTVVTCTSAMA